MLPLERTGAVDGAELYGAVSNALWTQRDLLDRLLYRLVAEQLVLTSGSTRWLAKADDDVRQALDDLRTGEVARAVHVDALVRHFGMEPDASLADLAVGAPDLWADLLTDHRLALRELAFEVQQVSDENQRLLKAGANAVRETLASVGGAVRRYDATGSPVGSSSGAMLLDEQV